jgi:hypothetical protein
MGRCGTTFDKIHLGANSLAPKVYCLQSSKNPAGTAFLASQGVRHTILLS